MPTVVSRLTSVATRLSHVRRSGLALPQWDSLMVFISPEKASIDLTVCIVRVPVLAQAIETIFDLCDLLLKFL